eukprot:8084866-Heterocapsa_arctica.AAC.1
MCHLAARAPAPPAAGYQLCIATTLSRPYSRPPLAPRPHATASSARKHREKEPAPSARLLALASLHTAHHSSNTRADE